MRRDPYDTIPPEVYGTPARRMDIYERDPRRVDSYERDRYASTAGPTDKRYFKFAICSTSLLMLFFSLFCFFIHLLFKIKVR